MTREQVLGKALKTVAQRLGLSEAQIAAILGDAPFSFDDLDEEKKGSQLDENSQKTVVSLIQIYEALIGLTGNDQDARQWLHQPNKYFGMPPLEKMLQLQGVDQVLSYLHMHSEGQRFS